MAENPGWQQEWRLSTDWEHTPAEEDIPGRRWTYTGKPDTKMAGCILTVTVEDEDEHP